MVRARGTSRTGPGIRRRLTLAIAGVLIIAGGVLFVTNRAGFVAVPSITFDAGGYVGSQILAIVNSRLEPRLAFDDVTFDAPATARFTGVTLTAPGGDVILRAAGFSVSLAEPPVRGRPIRIERVTLSDGVVRLIGDGRGGLIGFSHMTRKKADPGAAGGGDPPQRLSDVLVLRHVALHEISVEYLADRAADPIRLDHISSSMDIHPDGPGWYTIALSSGRSPGLTLDLSGRVNLDTLDIEADTIDASIDAGPGTISTLPPPMSTLLEQAEVRGRLDATGSARFNARDPADGTMNVSVQGRSLHAAAGSYRIPIESLTIDADLEAGVVSVEPIRASLLGGALSGRAVLRLDETGLPVEASCDLRNIDLHEALREQNDSGIAGILTANARARTTLSSPRASLVGEGEAAVSNGRLVMLPGLTQLSDLISGVGINAATANHRGTAEFTLGPDGVTITRSEVVTNTLAARATGTIGFDHSLNLRVNAGPLEKLQSVLGKVGDLLGSITDRLVKYTIKGTIENPQVSIAPFGFD